MSEYEIENYELLEEDINDELDDSWIKIIENEEKKYDSFYTEENEIIKLVYIYINRENKIYYIKKDNIILKDKLIDKTQLIFLLRKHKYYNNKNHKLISILQFNIDLEPDELSLFLKNEDNYNFLSIKSSLSELKWDDSIHFFKDLNSLHIIFYEDSNDRVKATTKKIYIKKTSKRKSRRKLT